MKIQIAWKTALKAKEQGAKVCVDKCPLLRRANGSNQRASQECNTIVIRGLDATSLEDIEKLYAEARSIWEAT